MKKNIRINFVNFSRDFDKNDNPIHRALSDSFDVTLSKHPDFLFYSCFGPVPPDNGHTVRIYCTGESDIPDFNLCDYAIGYARLSVGERYLRYDLWQPDLSGFGRLDEIRRELPDTLAGRRFCNFVYSNDNAIHGARLRKEFCKILAKYKKVDCPGRVLHNLDDPEFAPRGNTDWRAGKIAWLGKYKFTIAFENASVDGYMTEKMWHPLMAGSVPIYWGDYGAANAINPAAFVNAHDFPTLDALAARIKELDRDNDAYLAMLRAPVLAPDCDLLREDSLERFLRHIVERGRVFDKDCMAYSPYRHLVDNRIHKPPRWLEIARKIKRKITGTKE